MYTVKNMLKDPLTISILKISLPPMGETQVSDALIAKTKDVGGFKLAIENGDVSIAKLPSKKAPAKRAKKKEA